MIGYKLNSESERIALVQSLTESTENLRNEIIRAALALPDDLENGGKDYWYEKLAELSVDLKQTMILLDRAKSAKPMQEIKEEDL